MTQADFIEEAAAGWTKLLPGQDMLSFEVVQRLIWSGRLADRILEKAAVLSGLRRRGDFEVLSLLRRNEPIFLTPVEVAQQLLSSQSGMTGKLDRLEEQGLIRREPDPDDRRAIRLHVTESGRTLIDEAFTASLRTYESMLDDMSPAEVKRLGVLLKQLLGRLDHLSHSRPPRRAPD
ncbi:MAG: MarR family transcriptional regulator [Acidimicrobiia bacterium]